MKKSFLLLIFMSLFIVPTFSQHENIMNPNSRNWTFSNQIDSNLLRSFDYKMLKDSMLTLPEENFHVQMWNIPERRIDDNMTILKPRGNCPSLVIKPDSTIKYSLLIRKL